ncbi:hypothetical protein SDC9_199213 [bioreactor metagenome]|uniref:Putative Se/S carrier protein-like domain-containing protein n=1 Tax=bioreactor metagenome TaxID=1076179 RepID=A0A645IJU9_9ZZZZ
MRKKVVKLIITFADTEQAIACEKKCQEAGIGERLIPVPGQISAGCGLAWKSDVHQKEKIKAFFDKNQVQYEELYEVYLFERCANNEM